jgi:hypothetical protein
MLYDHRTYNVKPGTLGLQLALYGQFGRPPQWRHLGAPLAFMTCETGELNTYVHIWVYADAADRERRRARLNEDPQWLDYLQRAADAGYITGQRTQLMTGVEFKDALERA